MDCITFTEIASTERSLQLTDQSKAVGLNQQVNEEQPKGMFRRLKTLFGQVIRPKRRHQTNGKTIKKQNNSLNELSEYTPVGPNTCAESCDGSDGNADDTEPTHNDITSSLKCTTRPSDELSTKSDKREVIVSDHILPNKVTDKGSERTTPLLTHRSLTEATDSTDLKGIVSCAPMMVGCVDTLRADSRRRVRSFSGRRSDRIADSIHAVRDQSSTDRTRSQREDRRDMNNDQSSFNGEDKRKGSRSDFDVKLASVFRVEVSEADIRAIAEDGIAPTDSQSIEDLKAREHKLKRLLKDKKFVKVKRDGDRRYVRKAIGTSFWSRFRCIFCRRVAEHNQVRGSPNLRLEAQESREDLTNRKVNKSINEQPVGQKRQIIPVVVEPPLRTLKSLLAESKTKELKSKKEWTSEKVSQFEALKESFNTMLLERKMLENELERIRGIPDSAFGTLRKERKLTKEDGLAMSKSVKAVIPLLKTKGITIHRPLGKGGEAYVFYGVLQRAEESRELAVKVSIRENRDLTREYGNMIGLKHKNVIEFLDIWPKPPAPFIAYELAIGDMTSRYNTYKECTKMLISLERVRLWSTGIVRGLHYVHHKGISHNDLKMGNILMVKEVSTGREIPKIADFGLSIRCVTKGTLIRGHSKYGTTAFAAPECLLRQEVDVRLMDVWALGLIVHKLVTDRYPFPLFSSKDIGDPVKLSAAVDRMNSYKVREQFPCLSLITEDERQEIRSLLSRFLEPNVSQRESIDVIAQHSWFKPRQRCQQFKDRRIIE